MVKVSVVIPVYNVESYLRQCLDSVLSQTLKDIEIICVDDGSTDSSLLILRDYSKRDNRLVVLTQENAGAGVARNTGIRVAQGKYLSILDSDDFFELDMLEKVYLQCEKDEADICVFRSDQFDNDMQVYKEIPWTIKKRYLPENIPFSPKTIYPYIFQIFNGWSWDKMYRKDFIEKTKLQFQGLRTTNDAFFVFMANIQANIITIYDEVLAHHRVNTNTSLSVTREKSWNCCYQAIKAIKTELLDRNQYQLVEQSFINWAVHFLLWNVRTLEGASRERLIQTLKYDYSNELGISKFSKEFFYNQDEYGQYLAITQLEANIEKENVFHKMFIYYKENGMMATVKKILEKREKLF